MINEPLSGALKMKNILRVPGLIITYCALLAVRLNYL